MDLFTRINQFLDQESTLMVLQALVLLMVLVWLLTGGFSIRRGKKRKSSRNADKR